MTLMAETLLFLPFALQSVAVAYMCAGWFCASRGEVDRMAKEFPDDATSAAVIGCGPVGLMAILAAQAQGAQKVSPATYMQ